MHINTRELVWDNIPTKPHNHGRAFVNFLRRNGENPKVHFNSWNSSYRVTLEVKQ